MQRRWPWYLWLVLTLASCTSAGRSSPPAATTTNSCPALPTLRVVVGDRVVPASVGSRTWVTACPGNRTYRSYGAEAMPAVLIAATHAAPTSVPPGAAGRLVFNRAPIAGTTQLLRWGAQPQRYLPTPLPLAPNGAFALPTLPGVYGYGVRAQWNPLPGFSGSVEYGFRVDVR
jgi:hypothetical protein